MNEHLPKHLEMIQAVVARLAGSSFTLKGWSVALLSGLFALAAKDSNTRYAVIALFPIVAFWILDSYFLQQERTFRALYDRVRSDESWPVFSMNCTSVKDGASWTAAAFSRTMLLFYVPLLGLTGAAIIVLLYAGASR